MSHVLVFDNETTGLLRHYSVPLQHQPQCIEFGAALLDVQTGELIREITTLVNPGIPLPEEITKITGLTDADLTDAPSFKDAAPLIREAFEGAVLMIAHNLPFDRTIIELELRRLEIEDWPWPERSLCTVTAYRAQWGRNPKLPELYAKVLGRPLAQTHRAIDDVRALVEIVRAEELWEL